MLVCLFYYTSSIFDILIAVALLDRKVPISLKQDWIQLCVTVRWLIIIATIIFNCISSIEEQEINAQNSINNGTWTEGGLPVEGVKQISFAHGPRYNIFLSIFLASY